MAVIYTLSSAVHPEKAFSPIFSILVGISMLLSAGHSENAETPIGKIVYKIGDEKIGEAEVYIKESLEKMGFIDIFLVLLGKIFSF